MATRIGDILVREGLVTIGDVDEAVELGRRRSLRVASALVELGKITADDAARALAEQHDVPAALERHLTGRDLALASLVPAAVARAHAALPLAVKRNEGALVVCVRDPTPALLAELEAAVGRAVVLAVAAEIALLPRIAETYPSGRAHSEPGVPIEFDIDVDTGPVAAVDTLDVDSMQLVDLDHAGVSKDPTQSMPGIRIPFAVTPEKTPAPRRHRNTDALFAAVEGPRMLQLEPALAAIEGAETRDAVVDALLAFLRHRFQAAVVFSVKDGLALGHVGFGSDAVVETAASLAIPLGQPSVLRSAHDRQVAFIGPPADTSVVQDRFFKLFGAPPSRVIVVPVVIRKRVLNLLYAHGPRLATPEEAGAELGTVAAAAEQAFVRIILESKS